jgi:hypothetical protein
LFNGFGLDKLKAGRHVFMTPGFQLIFHYETPAVLVPARPLRFVRPFWPFRTLWTIRPVRSIRTFRSFHTLVPLDSFHPLRPVRSIHLDLTSVLSAFPAMLSRHTVSSIQSPEFAATVRPVIVLSIHLAILSPVGLPIFTSVLPPIHPTILSSIFASILPAIHPAIFTSIFLADVIGLGNVHMIPAIAPAIHGPRAAVQRPWPAVERTMTAIIRTCRRLFHWVAHLPYRGRRQQRESGDCPQDNFFPTDSIHY